MASSTLSVTVDDDEVIRMLKRTEDGIPKAVQAVAEDLAHTAGEEAGHVSTRLGKTWDIEKRGDEERAVIAPEWWAHFLAGGTKGAEPRRYTRLRFEADGGWVFARRVRGIRGTHFDDTAVRRTRGHMDAIFRRIIE